MSTQKGNASRTRPQKHKNRTVFKNTLHDTSHQTKFINSIVVHHVCQRCKDVIEWKIKYKKYKPLTQPKSCIKCQQRKVKHAYHVMCTDCGKHLQVCTKCGQPKEVITLDPTEFKLDKDMQIMFKALPERKRRHFTRYMEKQTNEENENLRDDLLKKLKALEIGGPVDDDDNFDDFEDDDDDCESD